MEDIIINAIKSYGVLGILLGTIIILFTNSNSTVFFAKLLDHFSKPQDPNQPVKNDQFSLKKLSRPNSGRNKVLAVISNLLVLVFFCAAYVIAITKPLDITIIALSFIGMIFPIFFISDLLFKPKSIIELEIEGNCDDLFSTYQRILFDMNMTFLELDSANKEVKAIRNGNEITIKIVVEAAKTNKVILTYVRDTLGILLYSNELQNNLKYLIKNTCYPLTTRGE
jgi:hypothetical protein